MVWLAPAWLGDFLAADYECTKTVKKNVFCTTCRRVATLEEEMADHAPPEHQTLRVGKTSRVLSVRVSEVEEKELLDVERIQPYIINGGLVLYLHQRPLRGVSAVPARNRPNRCCWCTRELMDPQERVEFCCIECAWRTSLELAAENNEGGELEQPSTSERNNAPDGSRRPVDVQLEQQAADVQVVVHPQQGDGVMDDLVPEVDNEPGAAAGLADVHDCMENGQQAAGDVMNGAEQQRAVASAPADAVAEGGGGVARARRRHRRKSSTPCRAPLGNTFAPDQLG